MDSERQLKIELGRALDEVLPPVPWLDAAVSEDLRKRRFGKSVDRSAGTQRRSKAFLRPAMGLVAGVLVGERYGHVLRTPLSGPTERTGGPRVDRGVSKDGEP